MPVSGRRAFCLKFLNDLAFIKVVSLEETTSFARHKLTHVLIVLRGEGPPVGPLKVLG